MALSIEIKVVPQSGRLELLLDKSGILKCFLKAAAEDGKANKELVAFLAKTLDISRHDIDIASGLTGRKKRLVIQTTMNYEQFLHAIGIAYQPGLFK